MLKSVVEGIAISAEAQQPLIMIEEVLAVEGRGLQGDRYGAGRGSYQKGDVSKRQVTMFEARFLDESGYTLAETRRNISVRGAVDLMRLFSSSGGVEFQIGDAVFKGVKYCDPCSIPSKLSGKDTVFRDQFWGRGGLIVEVVKSGRIWVGAEMIVSSIKNYD